MENELWRNKQKWNYLRRKQAGYFHYFEFVEMKEPDISNSKQMKPFCSPSRWAFFIGGENRGDHSNQLAGGKPLY